MLLLVNHETVFEYSDEILNSIMEVRLRPLTDARQAVRTSVLEVSPRVRLFPYHDYFGNATDFFTVTRRHRRLAVVSRSLVETASARQATWEPALGPETAALSEYLQFEGPVCRHPEVDAIARRFAGEPDLPSRLSLVAHWIHEEFEYKPQATAVDSTVADVLTLRSGVCQDFAHLMIGICREMGLPARYVSGYIFTNRAAGVRGHDASHAWCQVYVPGHGWLGFDPTNDLTVDERYVEVAIGRDYRDVAPTKGLYRGSASERMTVSVHTELERSAGA
ncbi:MAG: transglutaminase family protein [Chloroflexi bacterium]|nr:transglutaminase family protein [Chloroflexota bacterium]